MSHAHLPGQDTASSACAAAATRHGMTPATWDARYSEQERLWSGQPNQALMTEVEGLSPGAALDVGCGEGADAVWLAQHGWQVTAIDPSEVAITRAQQTARDAGVDITWWVGTLADADLPLESFDLVSVMYGVLPMDTDPVDRLRSLVRVGGSLVVVHHANVDRDRAAAHGIDPDSLLTPHHLADDLAHRGDEWRVDSHEERERHVTGGAGVEHTSDVVVRAVRRA